MTARSTASGKKEIASAMLEFVQQIPASAGFDAAKKFSHFYYFDAERVLTMRQALLDVGFTPDTKFKALDFGYGLGNIPEFLNRFFPGSEFTVFDRPDSPTFTDLEYLALIKSRPYVRVEPCRLEAVSERSGNYDVIILGEIIEHLDPTVTAKALSDLRRFCPTNKGYLLVTTPNRGCIREAVLTLLGHANSHNPPIYDKFMGYPHIHVWTHIELMQLMNHFGWRNEKVYYNHGFAAGIFADSNKHWGSLKGQILTKGFHVAAQLRPHWRDFMISTWKLSEPVP